MNYLEAIIAIMQFEKDNEEFLMSAKYDAYHLYPLIRWQLCQFQLGRMLSLESPRAGARINKKWKAMLLRTLIKGFMNYNPFFLRNKEILVISSSALRRRIILDKHYDIIYDPLLMIASKSSAVLESGLFGTHRIPTYTKTVAFSEPGRVLSKLLRLKDKRLISNIEDAFLMELNKRIEKTFGKQMSGFYRRVFYSSLQRFFFLKRVLRRIAPKIVFFHCGSYGGANALLINLCKQLGVVTAEFQHGYVGKYHLAYNYSLKGEEYSSYLPDYYLTNGQYWKDQLTRFPNQTVVIGNPELKFQLSERQNMTSRDEVLIVSQGTVTSRLVELTKELRKKLPSKITMVYRLHPGEVPFEDRYNSLYSIDGIIVDKESNIFDLIKRSKAVVGFNSTTLFEALPFEKPIYVMKDSASDAYIPQGVGKRFSSAAELADLIISDSIDHQNDDWRYYWELDWEPRFKDFLSMIGLK